MRPQFGVSSQSPFRSSLFTVHYFIHWRNKLTEKALLPSTSVTFVSQASVDTGMIASYNLRKRIEPVKNCRRISKADMKFNNAMPRMLVDPESYVVQADGVDCVAEPAGVLPLAQDFFVY